ncbi:hypothetical protein [Candidatus Nitrospira inopinata]|uniref:Uncharacterized protein n=1 Tax=Candidatus Nitrospira inopinata TaxID=1715989 RepID=A0A0S4KRG4_9BACT|nr:hypothetical protein [Candidatus Nitrospira inopinata]MCP9465481.1 hypothetical protein [Nitrospira sp.]CUQ65800.1 protein of unknown function [Candidatus Nitrospira inopinata]
MNNGTYPLSIMGRWCLVLAIVTLLSCETPTHLREDFGASYNEAIRAQTDPDHVRRSLAGSSLDGRAAAFLYEAYIERHRQSADSSQQPPQQPAQQPGTALPSTAAGFFSGGSSSGASSMPAGGPNP